MHASTSEELHWFTSSYSGGSGSDCVETAIQTKAVRVRDSKATEGPRLTFTPTAWADFLGTVVSGNH